MPRAVEKTIVTFPTRMVAVLSLAGVALFALAGERRPAEELAPRAVRFSETKVTLSDAVKELQKQTGNTLDDRRTNPTNPTLTLNSGTFWPTLDAIGKQTGIGFSAYQPGGGVALVDTRYRELTTHYSGIFRFAVKRIAVSKDDETQTHQCLVTLDMAWEPRFQALYLNLDNATALLGKTQEKLERQSARPVAGACATEIELRMKAPNRSVPDIALLKGGVRVIGAPKMLEFKFAKLATGEKDEQNGVKVRLTEVKQTASYWSVDILTEYPQGAIVPLESFQSWMDNNRVWLAWTNPKLKKTYELEPIGEEPQPSDVGTKIRYRFTVREKGLLPPSGAEVVLRCRTPNRVVAFTVPFEFRDLPLP